MNKKGVLINKHILITGASSGIGRECAIAASKEYARVTIVGRNSERLCQTLRLMQEENHHAVSCDLTNYEALEFLVQEAVHACGRIAGVIHAAGIEDTTPLRNMNPCRYEKLLAINVIAPLELTRIAAKNIYADPEGASHVFIGSVMAKVGKPGKVGYCASKAALSGSVKAIALELAGKKIRANVVLPGMVKTELADAMFGALPEDAKNRILDAHPLHIGSPGDIANMCIFLLADASKWMTGSELILDGGYTAQ